jgi:predicted  nucleic acid-binding Zn-ribbon protein
MKKVGVTIEKLAALMTEGFENLNEKVDSLSHDLTELKRNMADIKSEITAHGKAIDKDAVTLIDHESRLRKLEQAR